MPVLLNPYITFNGNARPAMEFYQSVFGGELSMNTFAEMPDMPGAPTDPALASQLMHAMLQGDNGIVLMGADTPPSMDHTPFNGQISLSGDDETTLRGYWDKLIGDGGTVGVPLELAPWGDTFGMGTDQFGIGWMVNILGATQ